MYLIEEIGHRLIKNKKYLLVAALYTYIQTDVPSLHKQGSTQSNACSYSEQDVEVDCVCVCVKVMCPSYLCLFVYVDEGEIEVHAAGLVVFFVYFLLEDKQMTKRGDGGTLAQENETGSVNQARREKVGFQCGALLLCQC